MLMKSVFVAAASALLVSSCATYSTTSHYLAGPGGGYGWHRDGRVEWVREDDHVVEGNPGEGAVTGAVIGGVLGSLLTHHGLGTLFGAASGAAVGAASSQGSGGYSTYDVLVRFDDGDSQVFSFRGYPPFHPGDAVSLGPEGLSVAAAAVPPAAAPGAPPDVAPSSPEPAQPPPPVGDSTVTPQPGGVPAGQWVYTGEYGWAWLPYGAAYTYASPYGDADPDMYLYLPAVGWTWVVAPWLWGWGPRPWFGTHAGWHYGWWGHGWGTGWHGYRPAPYRQGFAYHGRLADRRGFGGGGHWGGRWGGRRH